MDGDEIYREAVEIAENDTYIHSIEDIVSQMLCSRATFYKYIPDGSDRLDRIKEILNNNKVAIKRSLRKLWHTGIDSSPSERIALYKLLGTPDERDALNNRPSRSDDDGINEVSWTDKPQEDGS